MASISVIITTYNYARFLPGAIESVLGQTYMPDEVIVVDDGSTDDTAQVAARYADRGVRYLYKENGGASSARNAGIRASQGELLAFLDSDDRWMPDKLAKQVEHMEKYPQVGLVTAGERQMSIGADGEGQAPWLLKREAVGTANVYRTMLVENFIGNASLTLIKRECFRRVGLFDEGIGLGQDWDMWLRIARIFPVGVIEEPLIQYTRHAGSISAGKVWERYNSNRAFHRRYIGKLRSPLMRLMCMRAAQSMNLYYTAVGLNDSRGMRPASTVLALAALLMDPFYKGKLKLGLLLRAALGHATLGRIKGMARRRTQEA